jgi:hypothetical protein
MKKLMALIVIIMLAASYILVAEAVTNPFSFSLYNQIKLKAVDTSQPGMMQNGDDDVNGYSPLNDYNVTKANLNDEMKCSASITIAEIYTMGFYLTGVGEYGFSGDAQRTAFSTGMTNGIQVVKDYFKIDINADYTIRWESRQTQTTTYKEVDETAITATDSNGDTITGIDLNGDGLITDNAYVLSEDNTAEVGQHTNFLLTPSLTLSGGIPNTGFTWKLGETIEMLWNPENWKDTDPTYQSWDGDAFNPISGNRVLGATDQVGAFEYAEFQTNVTLEWEFFHFFAPENITCTLSLSQNLNVKCPYSYYLEIDKRLRTEGSYGFKFGLAGFDFGIFFYERSDDYLNTSAPLNGDLGSNRSWDGTWIGNVGDKEATIELEGVTYAAWQGDWEDMDAVTHERPTMRIGPKITFGYSKEWFSFGGQWLGYEDNLRQWDEDGMNSKIMWCNEFEIFAKFSL